MRRLLVGLCLAVLIGVWWYRSRSRAEEEAYARERRVTVWSRLAQVREAVATLRYGERVVILERKDEQVRVRTAEGKTGWVEQRYLMEPGLWQRSAQLLDETRPMLVQARGHTRVLTNVRAEPGRAAPRIYQFGRDVPVEILARAAAEWSPAADETPAPARDAQPQPGEQRAPRREDWLLVRARDEQGWEVAGWVLGRFLELDLPAPLRDYAGGIRFLAWFELNRVADEEGEKPQYLAAGVTGGEGRPCDFTLIRVYTWNTKRNRYETAYVESNFCGRLPIRVTPARGLTAGPAVFRFSATGRSGEEAREYQMRGNIVRRVRAPSRR